MFKLKMAFLACTLVAVALTGIATYRFLIVLLVPTDGSMPGFRNSIVWYVIREAGLDWQLAASVIFTLLFFILFLVAHFRLMTERNGERSRTTIEQQGQLDR